jgi:hypothetical protein
MIDQEKIKGLYVIAVWDGEELESLAVTAFNMKEARETAIKQIKDGRCDDENNEEPRIDDRFSCEITCAGDKEGNVYDVALVLQKSFEKRVGEFKEEITVRAKCDKCGLLKDSRTLVIVDEADFNGAVCVDCIVG